MKFCDEFVANSASLASMIIRAHGHNAARTGNLLDGITL